MIEPFCHRNVIPLSDGTEAVIFTAPDPMTPEQIANARALMEGIPDEPIGTFAEYAEDEV